MATPSPKRRKLSPENNITAGFIPDGGGLRRTPTRASFLSPTKASLARFNPTLLPRPRTPGRSSLPGEAAPGSAGGYDDDDSGDPVKQQLAAETVSAALRDETLQRVDDGSAAVGASGDVSMASQDEIGSIVADSMPAASAPGPVDTDPREPDDDDDEEDELATPSPALVSMGKGKKPLRNKSLGARLSSSPAKRLPAPMAKNMPPARRLPSRSRSILAEPRPSEKPEDPPVRDPELEARQQEKEQLQKELAELKSRVQRYEREIQEGSKPVGESDRDDEAVKNLIAFIANNEPREPNDKTSTEKAPLSLLLTAFLPFGGLSARPPTPPPSPPGELPSHLPVELDDPLPHLQLFTSLQCTSTVSVLDAGRSAADSQAFLQKQAIRISEPKGRFSVHVDLVLNPNDQSVHSVSIAHLTQWAEVELGSYIRQKATEKDIGTVFWAINSYWELVSKRAQCWLRCQETSSELLGTSGRAGEALGNSSQAAHLGRDSFSFQNERVVFRITWDIIFDWIGQAESKISAQAAFPAIWLESDDRKSLDRVSPTFDLLVKEHGVFQAISVMAKLLFS